MYQNDQINSSLHWSDEDESDISINRRQKPYFAEKIFSEKWKAMEKKFERYNNKSCEEKPSIPINDENMIDSTRPPIRNRSKYFDGRIRLKPEISFKRTTKSTLQPVIPMPNVSHAVLTSCDRSVVESLWSEWITFSPSKDGQFVELKYIQQIMSNLLMKGINVKFNESVLSDYDDDDFVNFTDIVKDVILPRRDKTNNIEKVHLPACCARKSCELHSNRNQIEYMTDRDRIINNLNQDDYILYIIFNKQMLINNGILHIKDIGNVLKSERIPFKLSKINQNYWKIYGEFIIEDFDEFRELVETIRTDRSIEANHEMMYKASSWQKDELSPAEILLFRHHFSLVDTDKDGLLNAFELTQLFHSLGGTLSASEAKQIINDFDREKTEALNYPQFVTLMCKIQRGSVNLDSRVLTEFKISTSEMKIFHDIEDVCTNPVPFVSVHRYGGQPITLDAIIDGPDSSVFANTRHHLRIEFFDPYPFKKPDIYLSSPIICVNFINHINGRSIPYHLNFVWNTEWTLRKLFDHFVGLMIEPDYSLLPPEMNEIVQLKLDIASLQSPNLSQPDESTAQTIAKLESIDEVSSIAGSVLSASMRSKLSPLSTQSDGLAQARIITNGVSMLNNVATLNDEKKIDSRHDEDGWSISSGEVDDPILYQTNSETIDDQPSPKNVDNIDSDFKIDASSDSAKNNSQSDDNDVTEVVDAIHKDSVITDQTLSSKFTLSPTGNVVPNDETIKQRINVMNEKIKSLMNYLTRVEQMHLNIMYLYRFDRNKFREMVLEFSERNPFPSHKLQNDSTSSYVNKRRPSNLGRSLDSLNPTMLARHNSISLNIVRK